MPDLKAHPLVQLPRSVIDMPVLGLLVYASELSCIEDDFPFYDHRVYADRLGAVNQVADHVQAGTPLSTAMGVYDDVSRLTSKRSLASDSSRQTLRSLVSSSTIYER